MPLRILVATDGVDRATLTGTQRRTYDGFVSDGAAFLDAAGIYRPTEEGIRIVTEASLRHRSQTGTVKP